ncbi:hypothetical protein BGX34_008254 [Mortierella sp. NVP85]|nr:hypothetical protein BGX34_008254 [Mortierella sp. NVP85]
MRRKHPVLLFFAYISCLLILLSHHRLAQAQTQTQTQIQLTVESGNAFIEGRGLYVLSGYVIDGGLIPQTFMIDLSISWNASSPAYKILQTGLNSNWFASAMSTDGQKWFVLLDGTGYVLDFRSNLWRSVLTNPGAKGIYGLGAATHPETGKIYIPFGYLNGNGMRSMMIVDLTDNSYSTDNINTPLSVKNMYTFTWNAQLKSFFFANEAGIYTYTPSSGWTEFNSPQGLSGSYGHCIVSSNSGSKVVLFGGSDKTLNATFGDIFILDVPTLTWKKGPSTSSQDVRRSCACAISNEYFIAWGGQGSVAQPSSTGLKLPAVRPEQMTLVYDLRTDKWVSDYIAPTTIPTTMIPTTTNPSGNNAPSPTTSQNLNEDTGGSPVNPWVLVGIICGALGLGLTMGIVYYEYRSRVDRKNPGEGREKTKRQKRTVQLVYPYLFAHAQYQPRLTSESSSAFIEGRGLYILGGYPMDGSLISQTFMIDLAVSWNTTSPAYKTVPIGPTGNSFASTLSADGQKWFALSDGWGFLLDFRSSVWSRLPENPGARIYGLAAATDPETGMLYVPFGHVNPDGSRSAMIIDLKSDSYSTDNISPLISARTMYAVTWNSMLKGFLYASKSAMYKYTPSNGWSNFNGPEGLSAAYGYCMVSSGSGSKVVLFGGYPEGLKTTVGDIFILDVQTLTWKKGTSAPQDARRSSACAISNDYFIAWGGQVDVDQPSNGTLATPPKRITLLYDLRADKWVSDYVAPITIPTTTSPDSNKPLPTPSLPVQREDLYDGITDPPLNVWVIIGAVGGVLVVGLAMGMVYYKRRSRKGRPNDHNRQEKEEIGKQTRTVQIGSFGTNPNPQHPHTLLDKPDDNGHK